MPDINYYLLCFAVVLGTGLGIIAGVLFMLAYFKLIESKGNWPGKKHTPDLISAWNKGTVTYADFLDFDREMQTSNPTTVPLTQIKFMFDAAIADDNIVGMQKAFDSFQTWINQEQGKHELLKVYES